MAANVFGIDRPDSGDRILFPGIGTGRLFDAVKRYVTAGEGYIPEFEYAMPDSVGVEIDPELVEEFESNHSQKSVDVHIGDFLTTDFDEKFDYVIANPPYIHIDDIPKPERDIYGTEFETAFAQYNLYYLFFEKAISLLKHGGSLTFLTPPQYLKTEAGKPLRTLLRNQDVAPIDFLPEQIFDESVQTVITTLRKVETTPPEFSWQPPHKSYFTMVGLYRYEFEYLLQDRPALDMDKRWSDYRKLARARTGRVSTRDTATTTVTKSNGSKERANSQSSLEAFS